MDRVNLAYQNCEVLLRAKMNELGLRWGTQVALVFYKYEKIAEIYLLADDNSWTLFQTIEICAASGDPGRKLREGDKQVPEGFYQVNVFNPKSNFHLSLGIDYPNEADRVVADPTHPGGDIYIHGGCASIGCCALTDEGIEPVYVLCDAARKAEKPAPKVMLLPCRFNQTTMNWNVPNYAKWQSFWLGLQQGYQWFKLHRQWPNMRSDSQGNYILETNSGI